MRKAVIWAAAALVSAGLLSYEPLLSAPIQGPSQTLVQTGDGYGVSECLTSGESCGAVVARGWCQANGYARLIAYRKAKPEDATNTQGVLLAADDGNAVVINCGS